MAEQLEIAYFLFRIKKVLGKMTVAVGNVLKQCWLQICYFIKLLTLVPVQFQISKLRLWKIRPFLNDELDYCQSFFLLLLGCFCPYAGGTLLTLSGFGFNENSKVLVGNKNCNVIDADLNKITCRTPKVRHLILFAYLKSELRKHLHSGLNKFPFI